MTGVESVDARSEQTMLPSDDGRSCSSKFLLNGTLRSALGRHQDQPGAKDISGRLGSGLCDAAEFALLTIGENHRIDGHTRGAKTSGGKHAVGKILKLRPDIYLRPKDNVGLS
jgi:hypothetical protein